MSAAVFNPIKHAREVRNAAEENIARVLAAAANADKLNDEAMKKAANDYKTIEALDVSQDIKNAAERNAARAGVDACNTATKWRAEIEAADKTVRDAKTVLRILLEQQRKHEEEKATLKLTHANQLDALKQEHWAAKSALERTMAAQELHYKSLLKERDEAAKAVGEAAKAAEDAAESKKLKDAEAAKAAELAAEIESLQ